MSSFESQCSLIFHWRRVFPDRFGGTGFFLPLPCEQALCLGKGEKIASRGKEKGENLQSTLFIADTVGTSG